MHSQLQAIADELAGATGRLRALLRDVPEDLWTRRPGPARWAVGECVAHLNLTTQAFLPRLDEGIARARTIGGGAPARYRRDLPGWLLWKTMGPPARFRVKTTPAFVPAVPTGDRVPQALAAEFERLQGALLARIRDADGLPIDRVKMVSPFEARVKYNIFAGLSILPRHQHRHLWQAEQAASACG